MKIIVQNRGPNEGWTATFFGVQGMPEDVEMTLMRFASGCTLQAVATHCRKHWPSASLMYRDRLGHVSHCGL